MAILNPPGWLQNAGATHSASQLRTYLAGFQAASLASTTLQARGGVHPSSGQSFLVTQAGSPNMTVLVESGLVSIPGTLSGTQGNYLVCNDAQVTLSITAAHATLPRIDIVVVNIRDSQYSGVSNDAQMQVIAGTPASSPVAPSAPDNSITIAQIAVGAAVTSITNANITDVRFYIAAVGGVINARTEATRPGSTEIVEGQPVWTMDNNKLWLWDGSAYSQLYPGYNLISENLLGSAAATVTFSSLPTIYRHLQLWVLCRGDNASNSVNLRIRFNSDSSAVYDSEQISGAGTTVGAFESLNQTELFLGEFAAASATAGAAGMYVINIPYYSNSSFWKLVTTSHEFSNSTGGGNTVSKHWAGRWRNTAAITSILVNNSAGNFISGSIFSLYGLP